VATDLVGRGIDIERVNIVINYDMPETDERKGNGADTYLHRVRAVSGIHTDLALSQFQTVSACCSHTATPPINAAVKWHAKTHFCVTQS
jgi:hypothetical protein